MGLLGPDPKKIDGENFHREAEFEDEGEAKHWAAYYRTYGFKARVIPNASNEKFEVWVSEFQTSGAGPIPLPSKE